MHIVTATVTVQATATPGAVSLIGSSISAEKRRKALLFSVVPFFYLFTRVGGVSWCFGGILLCSRRSRTCSGRLCTGGSWTALTSSLGSPRRGRRQWTEYGEWSRSLSFVVGSSRDSLCG